MLSPIGCTVPTISFDALMPQFSYRVVKELLSMAYHFEVQEAMMNSRVYAIGVLIRMKKQSIIQE